MEEVYVFNNVFYKLSGFIGEQDGFTNPELSYINKALEMKKGNSQSLGIIYLVLCTKLNIPVYLIDLPYYFILAYVGRELPFDSLDDIKKADVTFYINPVNEGTIFQSKQIGEYLKKMNIRPKYKHYLPCTNVSIITSLIYYLFMCYEQKGDQSNALRMKELYHLFITEEEEEGEKKNKES